MLVGTDDIDTSRTFCVYTMDPSGAWQSWGGTTAIGRYAETLRAELAKRRESPPTDLRGALEQILASWKESCKLQNSKFHTDDDYQVLVFYKRRGEESECQLYMVDDDDIRATLESV